jgi:hypothetical protein
MTNFFGFEATANFREGVKDPDRPIPRATYISVGAIGAFYLVSVWALILAFGKNSAMRVAASDPAGMFNVAMTEFVGRWATDVVTVLVVTSAFCVSLVMPERPRALPVLTRRRRRASECPRLRPPAPPLPERRGRRRHRRLARLRRALRRPRHRSPLLYARASGTGGFALLLLLLLTSIAVVAYFRAGEGRECGGLSAWRTVLAPVGATLGLGVVVYLATTKFTTLVGAEGALATILPIATFFVFALGRRPP